MFKKFIVVLSISGSILGCVAIFDYFSENVDLYGDIISIVDKVKEDRYTTKNLESFIPAEVKGNLKSSKEHLEVVKTAKIVYNNTLIEVPLYTEQVRDTFSDTVFATDGSFYIVATKNENHISDKDKANLFLHNLGRNKPKVIEVRVPETDVILYIQCYTPDALSFYTSSSIGLVKFSQTKIDLSKSNDEVASKITIDNNLYPKKENMILEDIYIDIVNKNKSSFEGYSDFIEYGNKVFNYYRTVGFLDTRFKVEFAKLIEMGYTPLEAGSYKGISYIKFKELTLLGYPITKNSNLIYRVSNLN